MVEKAKEKPRVIGYKGERSSGLWRIGFVSIAFIIIVFTICLLFVNNIRKVNHENALSDLEDYAAAVQTTLITRLTSDFGALDSIAVCISAMSDMDFDELMPSLNKINQSNEFTRMGLAGLDGKADMLDLNGSVYPMDFSEEPFFISALSGKSALQDTVPDPHSDGWIVRYATPVIKNGTVIGALVANHSASVFSYIIDLAKWSGYGYANITDSSGTFVIRSNNPLVSSDALSIDDLGDFSEKGRNDLANALKGDGSVFGYTDSRGEIMYSIAKPLGFNGWNIVCSLSESHINAPLVSNARLVLCALIGSAALFLILVVSFMRMLARRQSELNRQNAENETVISQSGKYLQRYDIPTRTASFLNGSYSLFGLDRVVSDYPESILNKPFLHSDSREDIARFYASMSSGAPSGSVDFRVYALNGALRWYHADYTLLPDSRGRLTGAVVSFYDNTDMREMELAYELRLSERETLLLDCNYYLEADLMSGNVVNANGETHYGNGDITNSDLYTLVEWDIANNIYPQDTELFKEFFDKNRLISLNARGVYEDSLEYRTLLTGSLCWFRATIQMAQYPGSRDVRLYIIFKNIQSERREKDTLIDQASRDSLTGLFNHVATFDEINRFLIREGSAGNHALFMIDIDDFKQINDTMGHQLGDRALINMSTAIKSSFRDSDIVGRIGGDEFLVLMKNIVTVGMIETRVKKLLDELQHVIAVGDKHIGVSGSVGITMYHGDLKPSKTVNQLYAEADAALYKAKSLGKNRYAYADDLEKIAEISPADTKRGAVALSLRGLLNNLGSGIEIYHGSADGSVAPVFCNQSFLKLLGGLSEEEFFDIYGTDALAGVHPDDIGELTKILEQAKCSKTSWRHTYRLLGAGGEYYSVTAFINYVFFDDSSFDVYVIYSDAEQTLRDRSRLEDRYRHFREEEFLRSSGALASFRLNISKDRYEDGDGENLRDWTCESARELLKLIRARLDTHTDFNMFDSIFSNEALLSRFERGETLLELTLLFASSGGETRWRRVCARLAQNPNTNDVEAKIAILDVDREIRLESMIRRLVDADYEFISQVDAATGKMIIFRGEVAKNWGETLENVEDYDTGLALALKTAVPESYYDESLNALKLERVKAELCEKKEYTCVFPVVAHAGRPAGFKRWRHCYLDGQNCTIMISRTDVTDAVSGERDALTGLYNQQGFYRRVSEVLSQNPDTRYRIQRFDIDNFKLLNETLGYTAGDAFLRDLGAGLRRRSGGESDDICFARVDADHFVSLRPDDGPDAERLMDDLVGWIQSYPIDFAATSHMGVYIIEDSRMEVSAMCDRALLALRSIKGDFTKRVAYYDDAMRSTLLREQELAADMENALHEEQFKVYFQPQFNYEDNTLIGAEALARWIHPEYGLIPPGEFVPMFERNGFITKLDEYIWDKSCEYLGGWLNGLDKRENISVSVNISRKDMNNPSLTDTIKAITRKHGVPVSMLKLEITESAYMQNPEQVISAVRELRQAGFTIEMDDFGTGYSSLNTLKDVPVDILKLDMKFLEHGADDERGGNILSSVIRMAHWLKIPIIAEGVETKAQADYLKSLGCIYMQGYYFGKPVPADEFVKLMTELETGDTNRYFATDLTGVASFWDPSTQTELLFNSLVGGASILEYRNNRVEILRANDKFYEQIGTTRLEYIDKQLDTLSRFDDSQRGIFVSMLEEAIRAGREAECDVRSLPLRGERHIWTHNRVKMLARNADSFLLFMATENIDRRVAMEARLREMSYKIKSDNEMLTDMMRDIPGGFVRISVKNGEPLKPVYINEGLSKLTGMDNAHLMALYGQDAMAGVHPDDIPVVKDAVERMFKNGEAQSARYRLLHASGDYIWFTIFGRVSHEQNGDTFLNIYYTDATEKVREEEKQKELLDNMPCGAGIYEYDGERLYIIHLNKRYLELMGRDEPDHVVEAAVHPDDLPILQRELAAALEQGRDYACNLRILYGENEYRLFRVSGRIIPKNESVRTIYACFAPIQ